MVRKAMTEQAAGASQIVQAVESMRKGATSTARAVSEQSTAIEQISKETERLTVQFAGLAKSMGEQAKNCEEITISASDFQQQTKESCGARK